MSDPMIGQSIKRREDLKYVTGSGTYVDDVTLPGMLYAAFVRSPHAHARLLGVDTSKALEHPKGIDAVTGAEAYPLAGPMPVYSYREATVIKKPDYRCLAHDRVRFVGEPVALVAAADRYAADDVAELVEVAYEPLEALMDPDEALKPDAQRLHDNLDNNVGLRIERRGGDMEAAYREADFVFKKRYRMHRHAGTPIETRGCIAQYNPGTRELTLTCSTQIPHILKTHLSEILDFPEFKIRVIAPDVGGGFGNKLQVPPEVVVLCLMAIKTRRPVKWIETRRESLMAFLHSREQIHDVEIPVKRDGTILGIKSHEIVNAGGYLDARISGPSLGAGMWLPGPYMMKGFHVDIDVVMTNKCPYGAYRGFGSQMGALVIERSMDLIGPAARPGPGGPAPAERHQGDALQDRHRPRVRQRRLHGRAGEGPGNGGLPGSARGAGAAPQGRPPHGHRRGHGGGGRGLEHLHRSHGPALRAHAGLRHGHHAHGHVGQCEGAHRRRRLRYQPCDHGGAGGGGRHRTAHRHHRDRGRGHRGDALRFRHPGGPVQRGGTAGGGGVGQGAQAESLPGGRTPVGGRRAGHGDRRWTGARARRSRQEPAGEPGGPGGLLGGGDPAPGDPRGPRGN